MIHLFEVQESVSVGITSMDVLVLVREHGEVTYPSQWLVLCMYPVLVPVSPVKFQQI